MKKLNYLIKSCLLLALLASVVVMQSGCKKDASPSQGTPVITHIRNYVAHPGDSLLTSVGTGRWVVISGKNLKGALNITFDGVKASFNDAWFSDTSAIALIPAVIAFPSVPSKELNTITYVTTHGQTTFSFPIVAPAPSISGISNESANPGDSVKIYGFNFFFVETLTYAGLPVTSYKLSNDGTFISLTVPAGVTQTGGIVSVKTKSGLASTPYTVHDLVTGMLNNYDAINNMSWGSGTSSSSTDYPGNSGTYGIIGASGLPPYEYSWWNYPRSVNLNGSQWVPVAKLSDPLADYVFKFEISVPAATPWTTGNLYILKDYSNAYQAVYRPWKDAAGKTKPFTTNGWVTVTIPLSSFVNDKGLPAGSLTELLGSGGSGGLNFWFINDTAAPVTNFAAGVDNMRVVKIK